MITPAVSVSKLMALQPLMLAFLQGMFTEEEVLSVSGKGSLLSQFLVKFPLVRYTGSPTVEKDI